MVSTLRLPLSYQAGSARLAVRTQRRRRNDRVKRAGTSALWVLGSLAFVTVAVPVCAVTALLSLWGFLQLVEAFSG